MDKRENDTRTPEQIISDMKKNGFVLGRILSEDEKRQAQDRINKQADKMERRHNKREKYDFEKPAFLVSISGIFAKVFHIIVTLYTMAIVVNAFFIWQIYKACAASGVHGLIETTYPLYIAVYFIGLFVLKKVYYLLYRYAND